MSQQAEAWAGKFGDEYTRRNRVDWRRRVPFWAEIIAMTGARSAYEVGCNAGWNLSAIDAASDWHVELRGEEINRNALAQAWGAGLRVDHPDDGLAATTLKGRYELVFTAGVLIHIPQDQLKAMMKRIVDLSCDWVLAVEYADTEEVEVEYRGQKDMLWRRDYGKLYQDLGLELQLVAPAGGFDNCTAWLLRKGR